MTLQCIRLGWLTAMASVVPSGSAWAQAAFDHSHAAWTALLQRHVVVLPDRQAAQVRYAGFAAERAALEPRLPAFRLSRLRPDAQPRTTAGYR